MILSDYHLHTSFSADSDTPMEEQIRAAIRAGLSSICFTEHVDPDWPYANTPPEETVPFDPDYAAYREMFLAMKEKYRGIIDLHFGAEVGMNPDYQAAVNGWVSSHPELEFLIGSTHSSRHMDPYYPSFFEGLSVQEAVRRYFEDSLANVRAFTFFQTYGHLDYCLRYAIRSEDPALLADLSARGISYGTFCFEQNRDVIAALLAILIDRGCALEVNTQSLAKAAAADAAAGAHEGRDLSVYRETNPGEAILRLYRELGGRRITVGADAHVPSGVGYGFRQAEALLLSCGFTSYVTYEDRVPVEHPLR